MKKMRYVLYGLMVCVAIGCGPRNVFEPPLPPEVEVGLPVVEDATVYRVFPGRLQAVESIAIQARVHGILEQIHFDDGDYVEAGQPLFVIEPAPYKADVQAAEAQLLQARSALKLAESALSRKQKAFEIQAVSELDLLSSEADVEAAHGAIQAAEAKLDRAKLNLSYTTVTAPIDGRVDRHRVSVGNLVGGAQPTLLTTLISVDPIDCYFSVDERSQLFLRRHSAQMETDTPMASRAVQLELADGSILEADGYMDFQETQVDPATGTLMVRARFPNPDGKLSPGMFGRVRIPFPYPDAMKIPERVIQRDMTGPYVLEVLPDNTVEIRHLELGPLDGEQRIVVSGLEPDARVIVRGLQRVRPGIEVQVESDK